MYYDLTLRISGFLASLTLTLIAYFLMTNPQFFDVDIKTVLMSIFALALIQSVVQLIFFIDVWGEKGPPWNLGVFISTSSIIFIVIYFSIWIINHLNYNMM